MTAKKKPAPEKDTYHEEYASAKARKEACEVSVTEYRREGDPIFEIRIGVYAPAVEEALEDGNLAKTHI